MNRIKRTLATIVVILAAVIAGCSSDREAGQKQDSDTPTTTRSEHDHDAAEHGREPGHDHDGAGHRDKGEESGAELGLNETYDKVRNGVRLIMAYDPRSNSFTGTVENTTHTILKQVRVEVHLSNGKELGPTTPADLGPGQRREVRLTAASKDFDAWTAHPEVRIGELGHGEGPGEHHREGRSEHR